MTDRDNNRNEGTYGGSKYRLRHEKPPKKPMTKKEKITLAVLIAVSIVMVFFAYRIGQLYSSYIERHFFQQYEDNSALISQNNTALLSNPERFFIALAGARRFYCRSFLFGCFSAAHSDFIAGASRKLFEKSLAKTFKRLSFFVSDMMKFTMLILYRNGSSVHGNIPCAGPLTRLGKFIYHKELTAKIKLT